MTSILKVDNIQSSGGTAALSIDSSGRILTPANPKFSVHLATMGSSADYTTTTDLPLDTIDFNIGSCVAISSSVATFTAPITGYYQFNLVASFGNTGSAGHVNTFLFIDGAFSSDSNLDYRNIEDPQSGAYITLSTSALIYLTATQTVNPQIFVNGDTSVQVRAGSRFSGYLVG